MELAIIKHDTSIAIIFAGVSFHPIMFHIQHGTKHLVHLTQPVFGCLFVMTSKRRADAHGAAPENQ